MLRRRTFKTLYIHMHIVYGYKFIPLDATTSHVCTTEKKNVCCIFARAQIKRTERFTFSSSDHRAAILCIFIFLLYVVDRL